MGTPGFGAALNLNVHIHALVLDGVFAEDGHGDLPFHAATPPTDEEMDHVLATIERRIRRLLAQHGVLDDREGDGAADKCVEEAPVLAGIAGASAVDMPVAAGASSASCVGAARWGLPRGCVTLIRAL